ncbi:response regulator transcription factor [Qipengyuania psychrotolerans]|uniref:Response regulator n=1 Tax=Qipengyuania psychrotolerans TaxID=2867238 RepID=A0ABX8ZHX6_9SPHN|nr:response regulator [Qipengyuania psychrotolerans]QZD86868.1 response regulator [Qipengyuania psychrotolerans]
MTDYPVYLVDDDPSIRRSVGFMLRTSGHTVRTFESGAELLSTVDNLDPGCILMDIRMPGPDGLDVQDEIGERGITFPVVVMTGHGEVELAVRAMKAGAVDFIEKPFDKPQLISAIEEASQRLNDADRWRTTKNEAQARLQPLTTREREVLEGLVKGWPNKTIGYDLGISARTVEIHRANLMSKLDVHSLSDLLRVAFMAGVGEADRQQDED